MDIKQLNEELEKLLEESNSFILTDADKNYLLKNTPTNEEDLQQIEIAANKSLYYVFKDTIHKYYISLDEVLKRINREVFLHHIARSAFHKFDMIELGGTDKDIHIDSTPIFN